MRRLLPVLLVLVFAVTACVSVPPRPAAEKPAAPTAAAPTATAPTAARRTGGHKGAAIDPAARDRRLNARWYSGHRDQSSQRGAHRRERAAAAGFDHPNRQARQRTHLLHPPERRAGQARGVLAGGQRRLRDGGRQSEGPGALPRTHALQRHATLPKPGAVGFSPEHRHEVRAGHQRLHIVRRDGLHPADPDRQGRRHLKAFDVLQDWAGAATLSPQDFDKERGVIVEEWRLRDKTASGRMQEKIVPMLLGDSKYAKRLPIGDMEIVRNAPVETLRSFYEKWYRPDMMAVVAVGDFDVDQVEKMIQERFSKLSNPDGKAAPRPTFDVPAQAGTRALVVKDPENPYTSLSVYQSRPVSLAGDGRRLSGASHRLPRHHDAQPALCRGGPASRRAVPAS